LEQQRMLGTKVREPPGAWAEDGELEAVSQRRPVSQNELQVLPGFARSDFGHLRERVRRRCDRHKLHTPERPALNLREIKDVGPCEAELRSPVENQGGHRAQRFNMKPQVDCRERRLKIAQHACDGAAGDHHVHRETHFRFEAFA
jgi:hypothetical protein